MSRSQFSSAQQAADYAKVEERQQQYQQQKDNALFQTANATLEQNKLLLKQIEKQESNYTLLQQSYHLQAEEYKVLQAELKSSKRYNIIMMVVTIIAMLAAVTSTVFTLITNI